MEQFKRGQIPALTSKDRGVANGGGGAGGADCPPGHQKSGRRAKIGKGKKGERKEKKRERKRKEKREGRRERKRKRKGKRKRGRKREKGKERKREEKKGEKGRKGGEEKGEEREEKRKKMLINIMFHRYLNISNGMNFCVKVITKLREFSIKNSKIFQLLRGAHPPSDTPLCAQARNWR